MRILKFTKKDEKKNKESSVARPEDVRIPISDDDVPVNRYYLNISRFYHLAQYIFIVVTLLFGLTCVISNPEIISYRNFLMLVNDINTSSIDYGNYSKLSYSTEIPEKSVTFDGGIAVPGDDSIFVYTETGRFSYSKLHGFLEPCLAGDGKYAVLYDFGTCNYKIYNTYTEVFSGSTTYPIYGCSVNSYGDCVFIESTPNGNSQVAYYSSDFTNVGHVECSGFAVSAAIDENGRLMILTLGSSGGIYNCELEVYDFNTGEKTVTHAFEDVYPIECFFTDNGAVAVFNTKTVILSSDLSIETQFTHPAPLMIDYSDEKIAYLADGNLFVYDFSGNLLKSESVNSDSYSLTLADNTVFILGNGRITRYGIGDDEMLIKLVGEDNEKIIASSDSHIISFGKAGASMMDY